MIFRSAVAVLSGLVVTMGLVLLSTIILTATLTFPAEGGPGATYLTLNLITGGVAALAGGAVAMLLAPHTPHGHTIALAGVLLLLSLPTLLAPPTPEQPDWYGPVISVLGPVGVLLGGLIVARYKRKRSPSPA